MKKPPEPPDTIEPVYIKEVGYLFYIGIGLVSAIATMLTKVIY